VVDKMFPRVGHAVLKVMAHHGVGVYLPAGQSCCGIPALSSGDGESYEKLVAANAKVFAKGSYDVLITRAPRARRPSRNCGPSSWTASTPPPGPRCWPCPKRPWT
jgi:hypothetical protein